MKNKKGFTLIELLCVIALLGVILIVASLSVSSIGRKVREKQRTNLITDLKVFANKYFSNTGQAEVYVDTLISEGYIEAEDEEKKIYDPVTGDELNCYYFSKEDKNITFKKGDCQKKDQEIIHADIKYCIGLNCLPNKNLSDKWLNNKDIVLGVDTDKEDVKWINPLSPDLVYQGKNYKVIIPEDGYINEIYEVIIKNGNTEYRKNVKLKVDLVNPQVLSITADNLKKYTKSKTITAIIQDNESGLNGYAVTNSISVPKVWNNITGYTQTITQEVSIEGNYYVWVKDAAGNTNVSKIESNYIAIDYIDNEKPRCVYSGENHQWINDDVTITWGCQDDKSGCHKSYSGSQTSYNYSTRTAVIKYYTIMDNAGNTNECFEKEVDVYTDKDKPSISNFTISSTKEYNSIYVSLKAVASDNHSGISKFCVLETNNVNKCTWKDYSSLKGTDVTYETTYKLDASEGSGEKITLYLFVKDKVGNVNSTKADYTLYTACNNTKIISYGQWGGCDKTCGPGKKYRDVNYGDYYLDTYCSTVTNGSNDDCNLGACCSEGTYSCSCNSSGYNVCSRYNGCKNKNEQYTEACTSSIYQDRYSGCEKYYITTCTNGTCTFTKKNGVAQIGTISASSLTSSLGIGCNAPTCPAYITAKSGTKVTYTMGNSCIISKYSTGKCADKGKVGSTGFKVDFASLGSCVISANRYKVASWGDTYSYNSSWTTHKCSSGERANCYCTGTTATSACKKSNTACVC